MFTEIDNLSVNEEEDLLKVKYQARYDSDTNDIILWLEVEGENNTKFLFL